MTTPREDSNTAPPGPVMRLLRALGYSEVDLPGRAPWWKPPVGEPGSWEEALDRVAAELVHLRQVVALGPKSIWRTREGWGMVLALLGMAGPALAMLAGNIPWVPEEHRADVSAALLSASGICVAMFARARMVSKALAAVDQAKAMQQGPQVPGGGA